MVMIKLTSILMVALLASPASEASQGLVTGTVTANFETGAYDMTGYQGGAAGKDRSIRFQATSEVSGDSFFIEPGISAAWYDPERTGEGFMIEILPGDTAVMYWFTYDTEGLQDWYVAKGEIQGNLIMFPELMRVSGGVFGPGFDPDKVVRTVVGSASFSWTSCESGTMNWVIDQDGGEERRGKMDLVRLSQLMSLSCGVHIPLPPERPEGQLSGSWYDPSRGGEGFVLEVLIDSRVLVYWFSFDIEGNRRWFFGTGEIRDGTLQFDEMFTTLGGTFGSGFDPEAVEIYPWGSLELELNCESGTARFTPEEDGFPAGILNLARLTVLDGLNCKF
jgi:hypothetical protein